MQIGNKQWTLEGPQLLTWEFALISVFGLISGIVSSEVSIRLTEGSLVGQPPTEDIVIVSSKESPTEKVCLSTECIHTASTVLWKMDPDMAPCDDFYQFACGPFTEEEIIPDGPSGIDRNISTSHEIQKQLKKTITEEEPRTDWRYFQLPKTFYEACMNESLIEQLDSTPMAHIAKSLGGWPVVEGDSWNANKTWSWQETIKKFRQLGFSANYIIEFSIAVDLKNTTRRIITFNQSDLNNSPGDLVKGLNNSLVKLYFDYTIDVAVLFGADKNRAEVELRETLDFEIALANITQFEEERDSDNHYNLRTIKQLQIDYPYLNWLNYTNSLLTEKMQVNEDEPVNIAEPSLFGDLGQLLNDTPSRVIANYLMLQIHLSSMEFLSRRFGGRQQKFYADLFSMEGEPRWKKCIQNTNDKLGIVVGNLHVRKYFEMFAQIQDSFDDGIGKNDWMNDTTKTEARKKLSLMKSHDDDPEKLLDNEKMDERYRDLVIDRSKFFESYLNLTVFYMDHRINNLRLPANKTEWLHYVPEPGAHRKEIIDHFYPPNRPMYINYGAMGSSIARGIMKGFDDGKPIYESPGNLENWWTKHALYAYLRKTNCLTRRYSNYTEDITGLKLNDSNNRCHFIFDNIGVKVSYEAYRKWLANNGPEPKLPNLNYTNTQMFWISQSQSWCQKYHNEQSKLDYATESHSSLRDRINGVFSHLKDFGRDFNCPTGTPMNPKEKCEIW